MKHLESMKGSGTVTATSGERVSVRYELHVYQEEIRAGTHDNPNMTVPGLKDIRGIVQPVRFFGENGLILEMQDGRKLKFSFTDGRGSIAFGGWVG